VLEDRSRHRGNLRSTVIARIHRTPIDAVVLTLLLAFLAIGDSTGEPLLFKVFQASSVIGELAVEIIDRVPEMLRNCLSAVHNDIRLPFSLRDVKG